MEDLGAPVKLWVDSITCLELEQGTDHGVRLADHFKIGTDALLLALGHHVIRHSHSLLVGVNVDIEDEFFEQSELLPIFIHSHQLLKDMLRNVLTSELACNDWCA